MKDILTKWFDTLNILPFIKVSSTYTNWENKSTGSFIKNICFPNDDDNYLKLKQVVSVASSSDLTVSHTDEKGFIHEFSLICAPKGDEFTGKDRRGRKFVDKYTTNQCMIKYVCNPPKPDKSVDDVIVNDILG